MYNLPMMYSYIRFDTQYAVWISCRANVAPKSNLIQLGSAHEWSGVRLNRGLSETSSISAPFMWESSLGVIFNCAFGLTLIPCFPLFQINDSRRLDVQIEKYFSLVQINNKLEKTFGDSLHLLHSSQLIMEPKKTLMEICEFLELHCDQKYVTDCASIVFKEGTKTRHFVVWTDKQKKLISEKLQGFPSIKDYNFYNWEKVQDIFNFQWGLKSVEFVTKSESSEQ